jgi:putative ABC transport system substrate-binding protein
MRRRAFFAAFGLAALSGTTLGWPLGARGQTGGQRRIGWLTAAAQDDPDDRALRTAFLQTFAQLGWAEGRNVQITYRFAAGDEQRTRTYAAELVGQYLDLIIANGSGVVAALHQFPPSQPILFLPIVDPVGQGFVASLDRPGGNITGVSNFDPDAGTQWVQLLKQVVPTLARVTVLSGTDPAPGRLFVRAIESAAPAAGLTVGTVPVNNEGELEGIIAGLARRPNNGLIVLPDAFTARARAVIATLAAKGRVPAIYPSRSYVAQGGLMSYGSDVEDAYRQAALAADHLLRGAKPADLPIVNARKVELAINLGAAKALGITVPQALLDRASQVLQ